MPDSLEELFPERARLLQLFAHLVGEGGNTREEVPKEVLKFVGHGFGALPADLGLLWTAVRRVVIYSLRQQK